MPAIPLRSPYAKVGRLVYFGRMLDKIRLHAAGRLPPEYVANLGETKPIFFDARCCLFIGLAYEQIRQRTLAGGTDEEILDWTETQGRRHTDEDCVIWNRFLAKLGWRDDRSAPLRVRIAEFGLTGRPIETIFDLIDYDEGRDPVRDQSWNTI